MKKNNIQNEQLIKSHLERIANILMINGGFLDNPGLYSGEMGLVIFFFHYAKFTNNELYRNFSYELIEKIQENIHIETPINYKDGLAGIGSAFEYLSQERFIKADTDELLEDFDDRIFSIRNIPHLSAEDIISISYYALWRISGSRSKRKILLTNILPPVVKAMEEWRSNHKLTHSMIDYLKESVEIESGVGLVNDNPMTYPSRLRLICMNKTDVSTSEQSLRFPEIMSGNDILSPFNRDLGLRNGLAGMGMTLLAEIDNDGASITWTSLLQNNFQPQINESVPV